MEQRSLLDYWLIVYERRFAIYVVTLTAILACFLIGATVPPIYEARAALYIPAKLGSVSYVTGESASTLARQQNAPISKEDDYKPYIGILKSLQLAKIVNARYPKKQIVKLLRSDVDFEVTDEMIIRVYSRDPDPELAAKVANAYVEGLNQILATNSQAQIVQEPDYIKSALSRVQNELKAAEIELKRFEEKYRIASMETELAAIATQKAALQDKQEDTASQIAANASKQKALLAEFKREGQDLEASEVAMTSPLIENLRVQLAEVLTRIGEQSVELGKNNLTIIALEKRRQEIDQQLSDEVKRWLSSRIKSDSSHLETLRRQFIDVAIEGQRLDAVRKSHTQSLIRLNERLRPYPEIKSRSVELNQNVDRLRGMQRQLRNNITEARLQTDRAMHLVIQLDTAEPPRVPAFPIWWLNGLIAIVGGLLAGIGYAFFLNYVQESRSIRTGRLVRAILGRS